jgi:hypothetical protein
MGCAECDKVVNQTLQLFTNSQSSFSRCEYLNISICDSTENLTDSVTAVIYNPMAQRRAEFIRLPVVSSAFEVYDSDNNRVSAQVQPLSSDTSRARHNVDIPSYATHEVIFEAKIAGNSLASYRIVKTVKKSNLEENAARKDVVLENDFIKAVFNVSTGMLSSITNKVSGLSAALEQTWEWYTSSPGTNEDGQASGAYIFRPVDGNTTAFTTMANMTVIRGNVLDEVRQVFADNLTQTVRLYHSKPFLEIEYTLGLIDVTDGIGKEVIMKFKSDLDSNTTFYTDANGREIQTRILNYRAEWPVDVTQPQAGNYYPVNTRIFIQDESQNEQLTVINDRSQGGSSLRSGQMELMVNRRTTHDDGRGVGEPLDEDIVVRGKFWLFFDTIHQSSELHRLYAERLQNPFAAFFTDDSSVSFTSPSFSSAELPENLHLVSWEMNHGGLILLRIGHLFAEGESDKFSVPVIVDLEELFNVQLVEELTLSANQELRHMKRLNWNNADKNTPSSVIVDSVVVISPMEIRTYLVKPLGNQVKHLIY